MTREFEITPGDRSQYDALSRWHYRAGWPATCVRLLSARPTHDHRCRSRGRVAGVLVVSMPAINGPWRERVWPGRYAPLERSRACRRECLCTLNQEVRVISRVVVHPSWRGSGVGTALVAAYLRSPLSVHTEALSAMGAFCGVFTGAGMVEVECEPARRVVRLRTALRDLGIEPWRLSDPDALLARCEGPRRECLEAELRRFAIGHRDTRALASSSLRELIAVAARRAACRPRAYVWSATWNRNRSGVA